MQPSASEPIVLPRPNLPPQPWTDGGDNRWLYLAGAVAAVALVVIIRLLKRRKKKLIADAGPFAEADEPTTSEPLPAPDPVRQTLVSLFGSAWAARTTEEIAASPRLLERFGPEAAEHIVAYLRAIDRSKFSRDASQPSEDLNWWAERFVEEAAGGAFVVVESPPVSK